MTSLWRHQRRYDTKRYFFGLILYVATPAQSFSSLRLQRNEIKTEPEKIPPNFHGPINFPDYLTPRLSSHFALWLFSKFIRRKLDNLLFFNIVDK